MPKLRSKMEGSLNPEMEPPPLPGRTPVRGLNSESISAEIASSAAIVKRLEIAGAPPSRRDLRAAAEAYERIVNRYAYSATFYPGSLVTREALRAVHIGRRLIYGRRLGEYQPHRRSFRHRVVESFLPIRRYTKFAAAVGILSAVLTFAMVVINPQIGWNFVNEETAEQLKQGRLWTEGIQGMSSIASSQIMTNNIKVSLLAFAAGITGGVLTLWLVVVNGAMLGGIFAALARYQMQDRLLEFIKEVEDVRAHLHDVAVEVVIEIDLTHVCEARRVRRADEQLRVAVAVVDYGFWGRHVFSAEQM